MGQPLSDPGMSRNELIYEVRSALGLSTYGTASTISNIRTRRIVATLEAIRSTDELSAVLAVCRKAASMNDNSGNLALNADINHLCDLLYWHQNLRGIMLLATALDSMPDDLKMTEALAFIEKADNAMFDMTTGEKVAAHLHVGHHLRQRYGKGYGLDLMLLVQVHPDKTETIVRLVGQGKKLPTHPEVIAHHGVEPVLFDGVL